MFQNLYWPMAKHNYKALHPLAALEVVLNEDLLLLTVQSSISPDLFRDNAEFDLKEKLSNRNRLKWIPRTMQRI